MQKLAGQVLPVPGLSLCFFAAEFQAAN